MILLHGAHGLSIHNVAVHPRQSVGLARANRRDKSAEHAAVEQEPNCPSRGGWNLPERDVFLILVRTRQHVAERRPVRLVVFEGGTSLVVVPASNSQCATRAFRNLHWPPTFADEESVPTGAFVPVALELPNVLSLLEQGLHHTVADILVHARHEARKSVHQRGRFKRDLFECREHRCLRRCDHARSQVTKESPPQQVVHLPAAEDDKGLKILLLFLWQSLDRRVVAGEDPKQHSLLVGDRQVCGLQQPLVQRSSPGRPPVLLVQRRQQPWLAAEGHEQPADGLLLRQPSRQSGAVLGKLLQLLCGCRGHHLEDGHLGHLVLIRAIGS
mmetsp:Transcript_63339/g.114114  ORF Transcript_63339/g.114114 Transcript_63339/m.114114 type:complete len:328 (+) Transcript_63339:1386-2369(+)